MSSCAPGLLPQPTRPQVVYSPRSITRGEEDELARAIPKSQMVTYKDTGPLVLWAQPHRTAADVTQFLEKLPQSSH